MCASTTTDRQRSTPAADWAVHDATLLSESEFMARRAGRLIELLLDADAQREARILFLIASRLRSRRLAA